jgi:hypothetical protein
MPDTTGTPDGGNSTKEERIGFDSESGLEDLERKEKFHLRSRQRQTERDREREVERIRERGHYLDRLFKARSLFMTISSSARVSL